VLFRNGKSTNCKVIVPITYQLQSEWIAVVGFSEKAFRSWWVIGTSTLQLVDFPNKDFVVRGFSV